DHIGRTRAYRPLDWHGIECGLWDRLSAQIPREGTLKARGMLTDLALIFLAYLLGSLSFGLLMARVYGGADLRRRGSGSIGATNVARILGKTAGILTLLGDGAKGLVAVLLAQAWGQASILPAVAACVAVLGHMFPLYHGFRGGKGVATALGALLPTLPLPLLGGLLVCLVVVAFCRYGCL